MSAASASLFCKDETSNVVIVEGKDDCYGIYQIASKSGLDPFGIWAADSDIGALQRFGGLLLATRNRPITLGLVLDCDLDNSEPGDAVARRWAQIQDRLRTLPYLVPLTPDPKGTIINGPEGLPRIGIWLMPDNQTSGMFEDFLMALVPTPAWAFVRDTTRAAKTRGFATYRPVHESKAVAHTYLAWQDEPGKPLGLAIKAGMFDLATPQATAFVSWLHQLFRPVLPK